MNNINFQKLDDKYLDKIKEWFKHNYYSSYEIVYENEKYFSNFLNVKTFKFTNSGTSSLYLIIKYIQNKILKKKPKILGPAFTHCAWINVCRWMNLEFDFIDVKKETLSLNPDLLEKHIQNFDIVIFVDMVGYCNEDLYKTKEICKKYNKILIEDSANAFGQKWKDYAGTIGDFSIYSFSSPKIISSGEGGAIVSKEYDLNEQFEYYIYQGGWYKSLKTNFLDIGLNFWMNSWITQLLRYQLEDIKELQRKRYNQFIKWKNKFPDMIFFESQNEFYSPSLFVIKEENKIKRKILIEKLKFDWKMEVNFAKFFSNKKYPNADYLEENLLYLPIE